MISSASGREGVAQEAARLSPWFHNLHLPDGTCTAPDHPLGDFPRFKWLQIEPYLPEDLSGWNALDVGCNSGFYSFELARRGARVVAMEHDPHFLHQARWAADVLGMSDRIEFRQASVYGIASAMEAFDLVLFMGVFYHLRYPLLALDMLAASTRRLMVFQSFTIPGDGEFSAPRDQDFDDRRPMLLPDWPKMAFIEHELAGDPTNWWAPNHAGIMAMLRSSGMEVCARPAHEVYVCKPAEEAGPSLKRVREELQIATAKESCPT